MIVVFSDLDGTLLDSDTYSWQPARAALNLLRQRDTPLVFASSKSGAEMRLWRTRFGNQHPFIVENGGAILIPRHYFGFVPPGSRPAGQYDVIELGDRYEEVVDALLVASLESGCHVRGFHEMNVEQVSLRCGLPLAEAELAKQRSYDEPFEILDSDPEATRRLIAAIEKQGKGWTHGDRFYHITGRHDKAMAARVLIELYRRQHGPVMTAGVGDGWNDVPLLRAVDIPIVVPSRATKEVASAVPGARYANRPGPEGWSSALFELLESCAPS